MPLRPSRWMKDDLKILSALKDARGTEGQSLNCREELKKIQGELEDFQFK